MRMAKRVALCFVLLGSLAMCGCRPEVSAVAKQVETYPTGIHRNKIWDLLTTDYAKFYKYAPANFINNGEPPPQALSEADIEAHKKTFGLCRDEKLFYQIHPANLFEQLSANHYCDGFGIVAEAAHGNGSVIFYYDSNTNYMGFFAHSFEEKVGEWGRQ
jgi:hypothetical protein